MQDSRNLPLGSEQSRAQRAQLRLRTDPFSLTPPVHRPYLSGAALTPASARPGENRRSLNLDIFRDPTTAAQEAQLCSLGAQHASSNRAFDCTAPYNYSAEWLAAEGGGGECTPPRRSPPSEHTSTRTHEDLIS